MIATVVIVAILGLLKALISGVKKLKSKIGSKYASPKLESGIKKIESAISRIEATSRKVAEKGLRDDDKIEVRNSFIIGKTASEFLKHLDAEFKRFHTLHNVARNPLDELSKLSDEIDADGDVETIEDAIDKKTGLLMRLVSKHWTEADYVTWKKLNDLDSPHQIEPPDSKQAEAVLKLATYLTKLKTEYAGLSYPQYAQDAYEWVYEVEDQLGSLINAAIEYIEKSTN